jgi:nicotinamide phosphoribosyltransferase
VTCVEQAEVGGAAHLVNFAGSDTTVASRYIREYYNTQNIRGKSVPATEHSIMCLLGKEGEVDMMRRVLEEFPDGIVACVSDTYGIKNAMTNLWGKKLKAQILSRPGEPGNQLVIRPDSGHVINTLKMVFDSLFESFGYTVNSKGFKVLPPQVRVIQGDGVNINSIKEIYEMLVKEKISAENIVFGMGGKLLQAGIDRDFFNFATKLCYAVIDGEERNVVKSPIEIDENFNEVESFKKSKQGIPKLVPDGHGDFYTATSIEEGWEELEDALISVFENGELLVDYTFEEICATAKSYY